MLFIKSSNNDYYNIDCEENIRSDSNSFQEAEYETENEDEDEDELPSYYNKIVEEPLNLFEEYSGQYGPYFPNFTTMMFFTWVTKHIICMYFCLGLNDIKFYTYY